MIASYSMGQSAERVLAAAPVIGPLDPGHDPDPQLFVGTPGPPVEDVLLQREDRLHSGMVDRGSDLAHRADEPVTGQRAVELTGAELRSAVGMDDAAGHVASDGTHVHTHRRHPAPDRRRTADRHHSHPASRHRAPPACGQSARTAGALVRRIRPARLSRRCTTTSSTAVSLPSCDPDSVIHSLKQGSLTESAKAGLRRHRGPKGAHRGISPAGWPLRAGGVGVAIGLRERPAEVTFALW